MSYACNTGSCGNCRFELVDGLVRHARSDPPAWSERDRKRNRWLGCQALPQGDCRIKFRADPACVSLHRPALRDAELLSVEKITHDMSEFALAIDGDDGFRPGQYALITAPGIDGARAYSMANLPGEGIWRFLVKRVPGGAVTGHLFDVARPGDRLALDGPYGIAWLRNDRARDLVLIAGGSGLSPMLSIARAAVAAGMLDDRRLHVFYGGRRQADLVDAGLFGDRRIAFTAALSEPDAGWTGATGFLHEAVAAHMGEQLAACEVYFAGPPAMSAAMQKMAHEFGLPPEQLHFDEFY